MSTDAVARVRFQWDATMTTCRVSAYDAKDQLLGELTLTLTEATRQRIWQRGGSTRHRMEEFAERNLRAVLDLRY